MPARHLVWLLNFALVVTALALAVAATFVIVAALTGQPLMHSWEVRMAASVAGPALLGSPAVVEPDLLLNHAELTANVDGTAGLLLKAGDLLVLAALSLATLWWLRRFAIDVRAGQPFSTDSASRLRRVGLLLIAFPAWQAVSGALWQLWLLAHVSMPDPATALLPSIARTPEVVDPWRLMLDIDLGYAVSGLVVLVIAQAFRAGIALRHENEEII